MKDQFPQKEKCLYRPLKIPTLTGELEVSVVSQSEIDKQCDEEEDNIVLCMPLSVCPDNSVPNSTIEKCSACGTEVWMSPATREATQVSPSNSMRILCVGCAEKELGLKDQNPSMTNQQKKEFDNLSE